MKKSLIPLAVLSVPATAPTQEVSLFPNRKIPKPAAKGSFSQGNSKRQNFKLPSGSQTQRQSKIIGHSWKKRQ